MNRVKSCFEDHFWGRNGTDAEEAGHSEKRSPNSVRKRTGRSRRTVLG